MASITGAVRRLALAPKLRDVTFAGRGFAVVAQEVKCRLEAVPQAVVCGFEWGIDTSGQWELVRRLELVEPELRGFAYEGAAMAYTVLDVMPGGASTRTRDLLRGPGDPHLFLTYIGIGFAMSHLPRPLWRKVVPDLTGSPYHPTMSWLAVDGYAFDRAYFDTRRLVEEQERPQAYPWEGAPGYFPRAADQGVGRALWFIHGGSVPAVVAAIGRFAADRQADLCSGVGLAATFAGGCGPDDLRSLRRQVCELDPAYEAHLAQGAVFAAKARVHSGFVPEHSAAAVAALTGLSAPDAARLADDAMRSGDDPRLPRFESWRRSIRESFASSSAAAG